MNENEKIPSVDGNESEIKVKNPVIPKLVIISIILVSLIGISSYFLYQYTKVLPVSTTINEIDMSFKYVDDAALILGEKYDTINIPISITANSGDTLEISAADIGMSINKDSLQESVSQIYNDESFNLQRGFNFDKKGKEIEIDYFIDTEVFDSFMTDNTDFFSPQGDKKIESQNSFIKFNTDTKKFEIIPEIQGNVPVDNGNEIIKNNLTELINNRSSNLYTGDSINIDLSSESFYIQPEITSENETLNNNLALYEEYFYRDLTIDYLAGKTESIALVDYQDWFTLQYDDENILALNPEQPFGVNEDLIMEYAQFISSETDTLGMARDFTTNAGYNMRITAGYYGWLVNEPKTQLNIIAALNNFRDGDNIAQVAYFVKAQNHNPNGNDYGNTYVEVSIASQHIWYFKDGVCLLDSPMVSGNPNKGNSTPIGMYSLLYKQRNATLVGDDYSTPVDYWMPFDTDVGFHDATWQPSFGGTRYLTNGSHGCINLPLGAAERLYSLIEEACTVIVY